MGNKTNSLKDLWQEARQWFELNIDYAKLTVAEKLSVLAAAAAVGIVCLLLGVIVLFFLSIAAVYWLSLTGMSVALSYTIMAGFNLLLLDVMMGGMSGFALAKQLKAEPATKDIPIIFLTARDTENDTVTGFNLGADDYISKPFSIREVLVRVRAVLRRTAEHNGVPQSNVISYQGLELNLDKKTVSIDGEDIPFTKTEFEILHLLLDEKGRVFSRQELIDRIWPKDVLVLDRTVDVNITRLRKKIGRFSKCIVTRLGFGYYFDA